MRRLVLIISVVFSQSILAQIYIDKPILLNGAISSDKQIKNLSDSALTDDITSALTIRNNRGRYSDAIGTDSLSLFIPDGVEAYSEGLMVFFKKISNNTGPVVISVNGLAPIPLKIFGNIDLKANQLKTGQIYCAIYSGAEFQMISNTSNDCRTGFIEINDTYCMEANERPATYFYQANVICQTNNSRLCRWSEWYYACQKSGLGTSNMTNNWEWTDDAANATARVAGYLGCSSLDVSNLTTTTLRAYRCCYSK